MSTNPPEPLPPEGPNPAGPAQPSEPGQPAESAQPTQPAPPIQPPQYAPPPQYAQPPQYAPLPHPQSPVPAPNMGGWIWLGILIAVIVPGGSIWAGAALEGSFTERGVYDSNAFFSFIALGFLGTLVAAIVLTCIRRTRRTGIGMWIGIVATPIIAFGVCTALLVGSGF